MLKRTSKKYEDMEKIVNKTYGLKRERIFYKNRELPYVNECPYEVMSKRLTKTIENYHLYGNDELLIRIKGDLVHHEYEDLNDKW